MQKANKPFVEFIYIQSPLETLAQMKHVLEMHIAFERNLNKWPEYYEARFSSYEPKKRTWKLGLYEIY